MIQHDSPATKPLPGPQRRRRTRLPGQGWDPRQAIFETAERLCAEHGIEAVSVRDIAAEAGVSLAALNYYFGSRTNLLAEILQTRVGEIRERRQMLLDEVERQKHPQLRDILCAIMRPLAEWRSPHSPRRAALQFLCRALLAAEPSMKSIIDEGVEGFHNLIALFRRALPEMSDEEIFWRFHFTMALEHMNQWDGARLALSSGGLCRADDSEESLERAVDFASAGFLAPVNPRLAGGGK